MSSPDADAVVMMDRFVSASSPPDATESLSGILAGLKGGEWPHEWIFEHAELLDGLLQLVQHGTIDNGKVECEDGIPLVCQIFLELKDHPSVLQKPAPGRLLEALLDVMESPTDAAPPKSAYTRVLALQVLETVSKAHMSKASNQWLQAPNGLHRLADLIDNDTEEVVRNQALLVLRILATQSPMAKVFLFAELDVKLLDFCWHVGGGLTKGNTMVIDALELILELVKHADSSLQDLVWQRPSVAPRLQQLLDLRGGDELLHPPKPKSKPQDDDLDDLLNSGSDKNNKDNDDTANAPPPVIPRLLPSEEKIVHLVLQILDQLLESETLRPMVWKQHFGLCSFVWELALVAQPTHPPVISQPSMHLRQAALELVARKFNDPVLMDKHMGLDRLLILVVTGGVNTDEIDTPAFGISQAALAVLRNTLDAELIHEVLLHTLAPPPVDEDETNSRPAPGPSVVQKLWNTVSQNLAIAEEEQADRSTKTIANKRRSLFLSGALGGLAILLKTEESREMMFKLMTVTMDRFLETLENEKDEMVQWSLLRFLCEWIFQSPLLVQSLLSSTMSTNLTTMASTQGKSNPLLYLLLGLAMDAISQETGDCGGWSRDGILKVLQSIGISKVTTRLENLKAKTAGFPWSESTLEYKHWKDWYKKAVWIVRKRIVEELATTTGTGDDTSDEEGGDFEPATSGAVAGTPVPSTPTQMPSSSKKALHKLLNQQSKEMEDLRQALEEAQAKILVQDTQLETWKRRMESTPTELDTMLSEFTTKAANLEETIQKMHNDAKQSQAKHDAELRKRDDALQEQRQEAERLRSQEQEAREDRDRMEQELQGVSQAYASLEEEFRQQRAASSASGAPTSEDAAEQRQSQGEDSQQTSTMTGSTEVATLREEVNRLRGENGRLRNSAMEADNWMKMAVERMSEMGAQNSSIEQQVTILQGQLQHAQQSADEQAREQLAERELQLRGAKEQLAASKAEVEMQSQQVVQLQSQLADVQNELQASALKAQADIEEMQRQMDKSTQGATELPGTDLQISELQAQLKIVQDESQEKVETMNAEISDLRQRLEVAVQQSPQEVRNDARAQEQLEELQKQLEGTVASKDAEILALQTSLGQAKQQPDKQTTVDASSYPSSAPPTANSEHIQRELEAARREAEEINRRSQEEIYRKEARIRELEDRLNSGMGGYTTEDIKVRDEEIEELRSANEAAQEWMARAVEHHELLTNQVRALTEEKAALSSQLNASEGQVNSNAGEASLKLFESQLEQTTSELENARSALAAREQELSSVKSASSSLEQELEIARDDLENLQRQFDKSQATVNTLESRLAQNALSSENENLRESNRDLASRLEEFQAWADMAQTKIADILSAKENAEKLLEEANNKLAEKEQEVKLLETEPKDKNETLGEQQTMDSSQTVVEQLKAELAEMESAKEALEADCETHKSELADLQSQYNELQVWAQTAQEKISELSTDTPSATTQTDPSTLPIEAVRSIESGRTGAAHTDASAQVRIAQLLASEKDLEGSLAVARQEVEAGRDELARLKEEVKMLKSKTTSNQAAQPSMAVLSRTAAEDFFGSGGDTMGSSTAAAGLEQPGPDNKTAEDFFGGPDVSTGGNEDGDTVDYLRRHLRQKEEEVKALQDKLSDDEEVVQKWEERVAELESEVGSLQELNREQEEEANNAITQWQEGLADTERRCSELEAELEVVRLENDSLKQSGATLIDDRDGVEESKRELDEKLASLEHAIDGELDELGLAEPDGAETDDGGIEVLKEELKQAQEALSRDEDIVAQWEDRVAELEAAVEALQKQLQEQEEEAKGVISQWQESYDAADSRRVEVEDELNKFKKARDATVEDEIAAEMSLSRSQYQELLSKVGELETELAGAKEALAGDEDVVNQWEERATELETLVKSLESQLEEQERDAHEAISKWQDTAAAADENSREIQQENTRLQASMIEFEGAKSMLEGKVAELETNLTSMQEASLPRQDERLVERLAKAEQELAEARNRIAKDEDVELRWEERASTLEAQLAKSEQELVAARSSLVNDEEVVRQWEERSSTLEAQLRTLEAQLQEQEEDAKQVVQQWQDSYSELEDKLASFEGSSNENALSQEQLKSQLQSKDEELQGALRTIQADEEVVKQWQDQAAELESRVEELRRQLAEQGKEAELAIFSWQDRHSELAEQCTDLQSQLSAREADLVSMGAEHAEKEELESSIAQYKAENAKLCDQIESERGRLQAELADEKGRHAEARDEIEALARSMELITSESEDVVNQWTERVDELSSTVQDLGVQLQEQEEDANRAIASWEKKADDLELELESLSDLMSDVRERLGTDENSMMLATLEDVLRTRENAIRERESASASLRSKIETIETLEAETIRLQQIFDERTVSIEALEKERVADQVARSELSQQLAALKESSEELKKLNDQLTDQKEAGEASLGTLRQSEDKLKKELLQLRKELDRVQEDRQRMKEMLAAKSREKLEEERDRLTIVIAKLEEELREANEMLQAVATDGSSKKATELAAQALRDEIELLRCQIDEYRAAAENERAAREVCDLEIERLRDDISALIALGDEGLGTEGIDVLTAKASEKLRGKERQEVEQIRKSLYRAIDELELARAAEKEANEKLSKARLQNSVCEQEIVAAKSEIIFLTQTLEDMRLAEEGKRASLEYHINSLEDENEVLQRYNTDELQNVRNELAQVSMEKDRILSQLKESEKTNAALVLSSSKGDYSDNDAKGEGYDLEAENSRLRIENAYLLTISANEKARSERRLREMLGAQAAATEADTILEHELRIAAEATVQTLKIEIQELKSHQQVDRSGKDIPTHGKGAADGDNLANEVDSLKKDIQKLKKENSSMKSKLEHEASKAREKIEALTEECRRAQAKSHKLERQGRFDAAVKSEITRTRMSPGMATPERKDLSHDDWMLVGNDATMDRPDSIATSTDAFDLIRKQKEEIQEERKMYLEFLSEHEDLLALLAQHDVEKAYMKNFMVERLGEDAVDQAILEAEEQSRAKFGQTIRAS